jgi:hypothetical protein
MFWCHVRMLHAKLVHAPFIAHYTFFDFCIIAMYFFPKLKSTTIVFIIAPLL